MVELDRQRTHQHKQAAKGRPRKYEISGLPTQIYPSGGNLASTAESLPLGISWTARLSWQAAALVNEDVPICLRALLLVAAVCHQQNAPRTCMDVFT